MKMDDVQCPSFEVEFVLDEDAARGAGELRSLDYAGYRLSDCQQLPGTLRDLTQYLVLELVDAESRENLIRPRQLLLFPAGHVTIQGEGVCIYFFPRHPNQFEPSCLNPLVARVV
jgi:hypothetical protein